MKKLLVLFLFFCVSVQAQELDFSQAFNLSLQRNLGIELQKNAIESSAQSLLAKKMNFGPNLYLKAIRQATGEPYRDSQSAFAVASINLFKSGADLAGLNSALRMHQSEEIKLLTETMRAEEEVVFGLIRYIQRLKENEIYKKISQSKLQLLDIAKERFKKGFLPQQEVDKLTIELENSNARLADSENLLFESQSVLQTWLGDARVLNQWPWLESLKQFQLSTDFDIQTHPQWQELLGQLQAQEFEAKQSFRSLLPSIDFDLSYGNQDLRDSARRDWTGVLTLTIPLTDKFQSYSGFRLQVIKQKSIEIKQQYLKTSMLAEFSKQKHGFSTLQNSALAREKTLHISRRLFADNMQRFQMGRASVNEVAIDQNRLYEAELLAIEGWSAAHIALGRLCHSLGRRVLVSGSCQF